jgi:hypothetical protein
VTLFDDRQERARNACPVEACRFGHKLRDAAIIVTFAASTFAVSAQVIVDGPNTCGANPLPWGKYAEDALQVGTMYGAHFLPGAECGTLLPGETCTGVFAYSLANGSAVDIFTGPPPHESIVNYALAVDPVDSSHLLYVTRDELIETQDHGQSWHHVNDMAVVHASAGRQAGGYILDFTPDGLTLIDGNQVSDDAGRRWRTLFRPPELVTHQAIYYNFNYLAAFRSNDRGTSWDPLMLNGYPGDLDNRWTADAKDSTLLYALVSGNSGYRIARSRDGGDNWTVLMTFAPPGSIAIRRVVASPDTPGLVYVAGDEYATRQVHMWKSVDSGDTWIQLGGQVSAHLAAAGCGSSSFLDGVLDSDASGVPLVFTTSSGSMMLFDAPGIPPPIYVSAVSRRVHGAAGTFDLSVPPLMTNPITEPRQGPAQTIVFTFDKPVMSATATITEGIATASTMTFSGNDVVVGLTGVSNQQYVTISLTEVTSADGGTGGSGSVRIGYLLGDVTQDRVVSLSDLGQVNAALAQPVTAANFLKDVNANGTVSLADKGITNANLAKALPPP